MEMEMVGRRESDGVLEYWNDGVVGTGVMDVAWKDAGYRLYGVGLIHDFVELFHCGNFGWVTSPVKSTLEL
jgi:hypothetical protein